ncbi:uncharacterized protein [Branchiostoma lanceolatum]|uniref:uncharacterized protein isoform X1 n=1 Tax=Branchiostoma lanceolatum TaxID=7740 RepID=UPI0034557A94
MAGSGRCVGLITVFSGLLLVPVMASQGREGPRPPLRRGGGPPALRHCRQGTFHHGNRCYDVRKDHQVDYDTAVERCSALDGGQLALFKNAQTMDGLAQIFSDCRSPPGVAFRKPRKNWWKRRPPRCRGRQPNPKSIKSAKIPTGFFWIGLRRNLSGTAGQRFHFADGSPLGKFSRWLNGQASRDDDGKDCVATRLMNNQGWKRFACSHNLRYICESEAKVRKDGEESTDNSLSTEVTTPGMSVGTTGSVDAYVTAGLAARQNAGTPTEQESLPAKQKAGEPKKSSVNMWLLLPGLQITGMLVLMVWGTLFAWKITEGGTRPVSATSNASVSAASDVPITERITKNFEDPE